MTEGMQVAVFFMTAGAGIGFVLGWFAKVEKGEAQLNKRYRDGKADGIVEAILSQQNESRARVIDMRREIRVIK